MASLPALTLILLISCVASEVCPLKECVLEVISLDNVYQCAHSGCTSVPSDLDLDTDLLDLSFNNITNVTYLDLPQLYQLNLAYNQISSIENNALSNILFLMTANFTGNRIGPSVMNDRVFRGFMVDELYLDHNRISYMNETEVFTNAEYSMHLLDLSYNHMEFFAPESIRNLDVLQTLRLSFNRLQKLTASHFEYLTRLEFLYLDHNELTALDSVMFPYTRIEFLDLRFNRIKTLANDSFGGMSYAKVLHLDHNDISEIQTGQFTQMTRLEAIYIEHTHLMSIQPNSFPSNVQKISIQYSDQLTTIKNKTFSGLSNLDQIDIENNPKLTVIESGAFDGPTTIIKTVNLRNNALWTLSVDLLQWTSVLSADLTANRLDCDCHTFWMKTDLIQDALEPIKCSSPLSLKGSYVKNLLPDDFTCSFIKRHKFEGTIALIIMVCLVFVTVGIVLAYKYRSRVMPCWYGNERNYDALYEAEEDDGEDDVMGDEVTVAFHNSSSVSNETVGFRLANGEKPPPTAV